MTTTPALRVGALQLPYRFGEPGRAVDRVELATRGLDDVDLLLPCEAALTGYVSRRGDFDLTPFAEPIDGPTVTAMRELARARGLALGIPWVERDGGRCFNSYLVVDGAGETLARYRKRRPWLPEAWATPGDLGTPTFELRGLRLTIAVCYDIHFVSRIARAALASADALLFPSSWVDPDASDLRAALLPKVARRHGVWVVNPNWGGDAPVRHGGGASRIIAPDGAEVARAPDQGGAVVVATITGGRARRGT